MKPASRLWRRLAIVAALLLLFTVTGFFLVPPVLKSQIEKRLGAALGRRVTVEHVRFNPWALSLALENFAIREPDGTTPFLAWQRLYVNFDALASLRGEWVLSEIALDGLDSRVAVNADRSLNVSDVLARLTPSAPDHPPSVAKPPRPVRIASLRVAGARLAFSDQSRRAPFATTLGPLTFALTEFRTTRERGAPYRLEAITEAGERITWAGTLQSAPLHSTGEFAIENIVLPKYAPYYADLTQADLAAGTLSVRGHYDATLDGDRRVLTLADGALRVDGLKLLERATRDTALELATLEVRGIQADAATQKARIDAIALAGGKVRARREQDGSLNLLTLLRPAVESVPASSPIPAPISSSPAAAPKPPDITVGELSLADFQVAVDDRAAPRPVQLALDSVEFSLRNASLAPGATMPLRLAFTLGQRGTVNLEGEVALSPLQADLRADVAKAELLPFSPYLEQFLNARVTGGALNAHLSARVAAASETAPAVTVAGDALVENLGLVDGAFDEELAGFEALALKGIAATTSPTPAVKIADIQIARPFARVIVGSDQKLNLAGLVRSPPAAATAPATAAPATPAPSATPAAATTLTVAEKSPAAAPEPKIDIGRIEILGGDFRFTDRSVEPHVSVALDNLAGTISGLSSLNPARADVDLKATVNGAGPVAIAGKIDAFGATRSVDLKVDFKNVDLVPLSPYSGKYAGFELARGKLLLDVKVNVDGAKIDAANVVTLQQFTFGNAVKSPEATNLPVRLGVALLKDLDGKIVIDVPIQGSTDDPEFKIGRVVWRVVGNLLTKAAVSPFSLLGAAFGGGGDELAFQDFAPGSGELRADEVKKLQTMVRALKNRPGLNLDLEGGYDEAADVYALKRAKLASTVRRALWEAKRQSDPNLPPPAQLVVTPEENETMVRQLFAEKFPPGTEFGAPLPPPPAPITPPPPPAGFFQRMVNAITGQSQRGQHAPEEETARAAAERDRAVAAAVATGLPLEEMTARLADTMPVDSNELRALAQRRAQSVRDYFTTVGEIPAERLFLAKEAAEVPEQGKGARVFLHLQ